MMPTHENNAMRGFTADEQKLLSGLSGKVAAKHQCSGEYVRHIITGKRGAKSERAQKIVKDLRKLIAILRPEE